MKNNNDFYRFHEGEIENNVENKRKEFKDDFGILIKIFIIGIVYLVLLMVWIKGIIILSLVFSGSIVFVMMEYYYKKQKSRLECEKRYIEFDGKNDVVDLMKMNGEVYNGEVVHAKKNIVYDYDEEGEIIDENYYYDLVIKFNENNEDKYIVYRNFAYKIELINELKDDICDMYESTAEDFEKFKENCINIYQFYDGDIVAFENYTGKMELFEYSDSINKNFIGDLTCKIYKDSKRYVIGKIEGYDYERENYRIKKEMEAKIIKLKKEVIVSFIIVMLMIIIGCIL